MDTDKIYKILIVDDSETTRITVKEMLKTDLFGDTCEIFTANDGREACTLAYRLRPNLILMDIEMPEMNGIEATQRIKSNEKLSNIPIIMMSSSRSFYDAFSAGADDFLLKPVNQYELILRVQLNIKLAYESSEIRKQHELLVQQKLEVTKQRDTILNFQKELLDDLKYASFIQKAIFPDEAIFNEMCSEHFIYNKPKNIVSGDFYWVSKKNDIFISAMGDCTGHGISGALMTIAGNAFLNEIVNNYKQPEAGKILDELRIRVIRLLHQKGMIGEVSNGMDISLCLYDPNTSQLQFAGANSPIFLVHEAAVLEIIKPDRMPIGFHINHEKPFTSVNLNLKKGDVVYMFSDGYPDQFGGSSGQKFRYHQFKELLLSCAPLKMCDQLEIIDKTMDDWMKGYEQVDDMLIIGLKF